MTPAGTSNELDVQNGWEENTKRKHMAIDVSLQYNGGLLPDIILLTQCYFYRGTRLNAMKSFFVFAAFDRFDIFSP